MADNRIDWTCDTCATGIDASGSGIGPFLIDAWKAEHQGHDIHETVAC